MRLTGNDKGLYATMKRWRIDPSSCLDTCWVDDMAVWWFRATCFHGLKYLCVNREVLKTKSLWKQKWKYQTNLSSLPMYSWLVAVWMQANHRQWHCLLVTSTVKTWNPRFTFGVRGTSSNYSCHGVLSSYQNQVYKLLTSPINQLMLLGVLSSYR